MYKSHNHTLLLTTLHTMHKNIYEDQNYPTKAKKEYMIMIMKKTTNLVAYISIRKKIKVNDCYNHPI